MVTDPLPGLEQRPRIRLGWKVYEQVDPVELTYWRLVRDRTAGMIPPRWGTPRNPDRKSRLADAERVVPRSGSNCFNGSAWSSTSAPRSTRTPETRRSLSAVFRLAARTAKRR